MNPREGDRQDSFREIPCFRLSVCQKIRQREGMNPSLFFQPSDLERIRKNAQTALLEPLYREWKSMPLTTISEHLDEVEATGMLTNPFRNACKFLEDFAFVQLVEPSAERAEILLQGIQRILQLPKWDYFLNGRDQVLSIQRGSMATKSLLFAREVLGGEFPGDLEKPFREALLEKGILTAYYAVRDMDDWKEKPQWRADDLHDDLYSVSMERYPLFFGSNNLRADPTSALGIGALALMGEDKRADEWLETALNSTRRILDLFNDDGSYFEGMSYAAYTLRTSFSFLDVYQRQTGELPSWIKSEQLTGILKTMLAMHLGRKPDGTPDIANFSDSKGAMDPGIAGWIGRQTGSTLARFAAEETGLPTGYFDFLHYDSEATRETPPDLLKNQRNALGWIFSKSGWKPEDAYLAFRSGIPCNHEHGDRNHLIFKYRGERLLHDPFGASYDWRQPGWLLRTSKAHNCVLINGQGHQYVDGREGTNQSHAHASILQYEDHGDCLWWTSDASSAYEMENYLVIRVLRSVFFQKPNWFLLLDQVDLRYDPQPVALRFFPDHQDGAATLKCLESGPFQFQRPRAHLFAKSYDFEGQHLKAEAGKLDLPTEEGDFPYVEVTSPARLKHNILTLFRATELGPEPDFPEVKRWEKGWHIKKGDSPILTIDLKTPWKPELSCPVR